METLVDKVISALPAMIGLSLLALITLPMCMMIFASGKVDYCYAGSTTYHTPTQTDVVIYDLRGFRNWREDRQLAQNLKSLDEVREAADKYGCELK